MWRWLLPLSLFSLLITAAIVLWNMPAGQTVAPSHTTGTALIGGDYTLTNKDGTIVQSRDLLGTYQWVYFGYSFCPDVCPLGLTTMTQALEKLGNAAAEVTPVFITIDPARDTPEHLHNYMSSFPDRFLALSGSQQAIDQAIRAYRVYAVRSGEAGKHYLMDHSSYIYLMDREGKYVQHFRHDAPVDELVKAVNVRLAAESSHPPSSTE